MAGSSSLELAVEFELAVELELAGEIKLAVRPVRLAVLVRLTVEVAASGAPVSSTSSCSPGHRGHLFYLAQPKPGGNIP